jgi:sulfur relay (sulfurtransferase) DsrF/TusC family protein
MTTKKKYTVSVTFSADKTYEVEADDESEALDEADFLATKEVINTLDVEFYAQAHYAKEGWDEEDKEVEDPR